MNPVPRQRWRTSSPKPISVSRFESIIQFLLTDFMPGLDTSNRELRTQLVAGEIQRNLSGDSCLNICQPFALDKIEQLQIDLTLHKDGTTSCELRILFLSNMVNLSVSDVGTGWCDAVFEEAERKFKEFGIFKGEWLNNVTLTLSRLQNVFLIAGAALLLSPPNASIDFTYFAFALLATGIVPVASDIYRVYFPKKPSPIVEYKARQLEFSFEKPALWIGLLSGVATLTRELITLLK